LLHAAALLGQETGCTNVLRSEISGLREEGVRKFAEAREFLWSHWLNKNCAELFLTTWSREGVRTDSHYKIEKIGSNGIVLRVTLSRKDDPSAPVDGLAVPPSGQIPRTVSETDSYQASTIERIEVRVPFDVEKAKTIPESEVVPPSKYHLRFKDKDGKVITDF